MKYVVLGLAVVMYGFVIAFPHRKAWFTLGVAAVVVALGVVAPATVVGELINWNVLLIYVGSLVIADLFIYSRVPSHLADRIVGKAPNLGWGVVFILIMTGLLSAFVENVATVLVMAPIALALSDKMKVDARYFMMGLAVMSNLQGTATLVGDPPSMIFAGFAGYSFNDFFFKEGRLSIFFAVQVGMIVGAAFFYFFYRKMEKSGADLPDERVRTWFPTILLVALIVGLATISFLFEGFSILSGGYVFALGLVGLVWYRLAMKESHAEAWRLVKGLDWETILFLVGIFVVVGAIAKTGLLVDLSAFLSGIIGANVALGFVVIVGVSVILSGFIDNVPYIIVMLPVAAELASGLGLKPELYMFGLLIGSCLGGNLTPFGASANVVAVGMLRKRGTVVNFGDWLKVAGPFTILTTIASSIFVWAVWR
ncbi:MAG: citrate transporter [Spirochaetae bacterium HGW-Spirochaetae-7]|jgi:Na+/H+ antiporter NhaD/arsenite permease-like protein|nr:MAG: citrate transporter [Spirochaetae bacterium HGW-Spirochaetae-7]